MRRAVIVGIVVVVAGGLAAGAFVLFWDRAGGASCPLAITEFAVAPKDGVVGVAGRVTHPDGAPFKKGPVEVNLTFMMPGCGFLPFSVATDDRGRFSGESPRPQGSMCVLQGGTATVRVRGGCEVEGVSQGSW